MNENTPQTEPSGDGEQHYMLVCVASLAVLLLALLQRGAGSWSLLPVGVGLLGVVLRWRIAPVAMLLALGGLLFVLSVQRLGRVQARLSGTRLLADLLLCTAVLVFVAAAYRLLSVTRRVWPDDARRLPKGSARPSPARKVALVTPEEIGLLLATLPMWAGLALFTYPYLLPRSDSPGVIDRSRLQAHRDGGLEALGVTLEALTEFAWSGGFLIWGLGGGVLAVSAGLTYLAARHMTPAEATLYLQDVTWQETRREQRRVNRWLAWMRLRKPQPPKKEGP